MTISLPPASLFKNFRTGNYTLIWSGLKEELTWAIDKRLRIISTIILFKKQ